MSRTATESRNRKEQIMGIIQTKRIVGFHPVSETEKVEIIESLDGDYYTRFVVNGVVRGNLRGSNGPGLVGWINAQTQAASWAKGMRYDRQRLPKVAR